jgi:flagellar hook-length control protein FliK
MQDLVALLAQDASHLSQDTGDGKGRSGADALQTDTASKAAAPDGSSAATSSSSAQLGLASQFGVQHARTDSNTVTADLRAPVGTGAWNDELGGQVTWMAHQGIESASLRLSPEHLGPVEVHISVHNNDATVWFGASQPDTRAALEQALPRLRQMFASQGLTLADSGVSRESPRQQGRASSTPGISAVSSVGSTDAPASSAMRLSLGLVDTYA